MGRLIDADALLQDIRENMPNYEVKKDFLLFVHAQPTAYDVDAVVAELKNETQYVDLSNPSSKVRFEVKAIHPQKAIEIVRKGGVE